MKNIEYLKYTYNHRKAFRFVLDEFVRKDLLTEDETQTMYERAAIHDLDKAFLYTLIEKPLASEYHKLTAPHHIRRENPTHGLTYDYLEAIIDYECAHYTKADKPKNAFDTINMVSWMTDMDRKYMLKLCDRFGIMYSYTRSPEEPDWVAYQKSYMEVAPDTEENIMCEIYKYLTNVDLYQAPGQHRIEFGHGTIMHDLRLDCRGYTITPGLVEYMVKKKIDEIKSESTK
jgi:hypothetical protein